MKVTRTPLHIGVALSRHRLVAVRSGGGSGATVLDLDSYEGSDQWPSLVAALEKVRTAAGAAEGSLSISLAPDLAQTKSIDVPAMRRDDLERVLTRNAAKYFLSARQPLVVTVSQSRLGQRVTGVLASAVPARLVAAVEGAARDAGLSIRDIAPAEAAWLDCARDCWREVRRGRHQVAVLLDDRTELLQLRDGHIEALRRFRVDDADAGALRAAVAEGGPAGPLSRLFVIAGSDRASRIRNALHDVTIVRPTGALAALTEDPLLAAAAFAGATDTLRVLTAAGQTRRRDRERRQVLGTFAAAALILVGAGAVRYLSAGRELRAVEAERAALRSDVAGIVAAQNYVSATTRQIDELRSVNSGQRRWSQVLAALSTYLPGGAELTTLHVNGDSISLEGYATAAADVYAAMAQDRALQDVHSTAPVRSNFLESGEPRERFALAAHLRRFGDTSSSSAAGEGGKR